MFFWNICVMRHTIIYCVFDRLVKRLPSTYPQIKLRIYPTLSLLQQEYWSDQSKLALDAGDPGTSPYAFCDDNNIIHVHIAIGRDPVDQIYFYLLHEIGHLYALKKYGKKDPRWADYRTAERYANQFAYRWLKILKRERFLIK